jgi:eukaryotic-like serine/threonine-protein kinase
MTVSAAPTGRPALEQRAAGGHDRDGGRLLRRALAEADGERFRVAMAVAAVLSTAGTALLQVVEPKERIHWMVTGLALTTAAVSAATACLSAQRRLAGKYLVGLLLTLTALVAIAYLGVFSPAVIFLCVLVFAFGLGERRLPAYALFLVATVGYLGLAVAALLGKISPLQGPFALQRLRGVELAGCTAVVELVLALGFWFARRSRSATELALDRAEDAQREVSRHAALLCEAHADLERIVDAGRMGQLSEQQIGRYRIGEIIGRGAMGEVYFAWDMDRQQPAALKVLHESLKRDPVLVDRFLREVRVLRELRSPHIVEVLASGLTADGRPYLVMELLRGRDLARVLREHGRLQYDEAMRLLSNLAVALQTAHDAGIVHRDVKPQNVFLAETDQGAVWKVLDFGVSKLLDGSGTLTQDGIVGTPSYMAPEQVLGRAVDARADVFALAAIAYRALTGRPAFVGSDPWAMLYQVVAEQPARPSSLVPLQPDVDLVLGLGLAKNPACRFSSVTRFALAMHQASRGCAPEGLRRLAREVLAETPWRGEEGAERSEQATLALRQLRETVPLGSASFREMPVPRVSGERLRDGLFDDSSEGFG